MTSAFDVRDCALSFSRDGDQRPIVKALRQGVLVADRVFDDALFNEEFQRVSASFWTPVEVAVRVVELFESTLRALGRKGNKRVTLLDIGSGVGKFCLVAGASRPSFDVHGIEHRPHLVASARDASRRLGLTNAHFHDGAIDDLLPNRPDLSVEDVDGFYLFNPFAENLTERHDRLDSTVDLSDARFLHDIGVMEEILRRARVGALLITYCGFGGLLPRGQYQLVDRQTCAGTLEVWAKVRDW